MTDTTLEILEKRTFEFSTLSTGTSQAFIVLEQIDVSQFSFATLKLRVHSCDTSGGSIVFDFLGDGATEEDPGQSFETSTPLFPALAVPSAAPAVVASGGPIPGQMGVLRVSATKASSSPLRATVSIELVLREASFTPNDVGGCVLWLDMLETGSFTVKSGTPNTVSAIKNLASGVVWTEPTNPPEFEQTGLNGRPCMKGNGTTMGIISSEAAVAGLISGNDRAFTVFVALDPLSAPASQGYFGWGNSGNTNPRGQVGQSSGGNGFEIARVDDTGVNNLNIVRSQPAAVRPQIVTYVVEGKTGSMFVDNEAIPNPSSANFSVGQMTIDRTGILCRPRPTPDYFTAARIGALLVFKPLAPNDRDSVRGWLKTRWGIP